jgi:hypothetical protein
MNETNSEPLPFEPFEDDREEVSFVADSEEDRS